MALMDYFAPKKDFSNSDLLNNKSGVEDFSHLFISLSHIINAIDRAKKDNDYEMLDNVLKSDDLISIEDEMSFSSSYLRLSQQSNYSYICNILSRYYYQKSNIPSVKELSILAIAADDILTERYQHALFGKDNINLSCFLIGGEKYIEIFINKFSELYSELKNKKIKISNENLGFFAVIALKQNEGLLNEVIRYASGDFEESLKIRDETYGPIEIASLVGNRKFIEQALEKTQDSEVIANILVNTISQEQLRVIQVTCDNYLNGNEEVKQLYMEAFVNPHVIKEIDTQLFKNLDSRNRKEIYDQILNTLLNADNWQAIEKILDKAENKVIKQQREPLKQTLSIILEYTISKKTALAIGNLYNRYSNLNNENIRAIYERYVLPFNVIKFNKINDKHKYSNNLAQVLRINTFFYEGKPKYYTVETKSGKTILLLNSINQQFLIYEFFRIQEGKYIYSNRTYNDINILINKPLLYNILQKVVLDTCRDISIETMKHSKGDTDNSLQNKSAQKENDKELTYNEQTLEKETTLQIKSDETPKPKEDNSPIKMETSITSADHTSKSLLKKDTNSNKHVTNEFSDENHSKTFNMQKDKKFKQDQHNNKKSCIFGCVSGSCVGLAIAYFVGTAALTPVYVAISVFVGMILAGALMGYIITKLCENKVETKIESPCANHHNVQEIAV